MGTNYYLQHGVCECCKKPESTRHIGKSSGGWCFSLHVYQEEGINTLDDWKKLWETEKNKIVNEYDEVVSVEDMLDTIINRQGRPMEDKHLTMMGLYESWQDFHRNIYSCSGSNNLLRH